MKLPILTRGRHIITTGRLVVAALLRLSLRIQNSRLLRCWRFFTCNQGRIYNPVHDGSGILGSDAARRRILIYLFLLNGNGRTT